MAGVKVDKKQRAKNFSEGELNIIIEGVALKKDLIFSKLNTAVASKDKDKAWNNIADQLNSQFYGTRTGKQVKKKWQDVKQECLRIRALQKCPPTGGGPPPEDPWYADAVLDVLGEKTNLLDGIPGGHESDAPVVPVVNKEDNNVVPGAVQKGASVVCGLSSIIIPDDDDSSAQASTTGHPVASAPLISSNTATNMLPGESAHSSSSPPPTNLQGSSKPSSASSKQNALAQLKKQTKNRKLQSGENTQSKREWADEKVGELAVEDREYVLMKKRKVELELEVLKIEKANKLLLQAKTVLEIRNLESALGLSSTIDNIPLSYDKRQS